MKTGGWCGGLGGRTGRLMVSDDRVRGDDCLHEKNTDEAAQHLLYGA